jgi:hypothetical protein
MSRANRDRAAALAASEAAQRAAKAETERINQEQRNEHDTPAPSAQSIPNAAEHSNMHDTPQPARVGAVRARTWG